MPTQVVICGAGPTGLLLAGELTLAGIEVVVLERLETRTGQSKALGLQPRSIEILAARGLLEPLLDQADARIPAGHYAGLPLDYTNLDTRYPYQLGIPQARVEEVLEATLAGRGIQVRYRSAVTDLDQDENGVTVHLAGGATSLRADYLIGCDGGRSTVRALLGVPFVGRDPRMSAVVADITLADRTGAPTGWELPSLTPVDGVVVSLIPLRDGVFRLLTAGPEQQSADRDTPVSAAEIDRALAHAYAGAVQLGEIRWASRFSDTTRQAAHYRTGRVLLAGDAAHVHSPTGGQGLNLGLQDAFNLGWKLAATLRGDGPDHLLDSYHDERHPIAAQVLTGTLAQGVLMVPDGDVLALRSVVADLLRLPAVNRALAGQVSGLDLSYPQPGGHPLTGRRMPDADVLLDGEPTSLARLQHDGQGLLLRSDGAVASALIRPDGYVAWASAPGEDDEAGLAAATARWFGDRAVREVRVTTPTGHRSSDTTRAA